MTFADLLDDHAIAAFDRQLHLADVIGGRPWRVDLLAGTLSFGNDLRFTAELLGTQSDESATFLWAWDHPSLPHPARQAKMAAAVRDVGERLGVPELTTRQIGVDDRANAHTLAMVAVGLTGADAYYRGPYDGGAAVMLIRDPAFPRPAVEFPLLHATTVVPQAISAVDLRHDRAVPAYLRDLGTGEPTANGVTCRDARGQVLTATFDGRGRLAELATTAKSIGVTHFLEKVATNGTNQHESDFPIRGHSCHSWPPPRPSA